MNFIERLIPEKVVFYEVRQQTRRLLSGATKGGQIAVAIVILGAFFVVCYSILQIAYDFPIEIFPFALVGVFSLILPPVVSGTISGELQKRSLEGILAAPLSSFQIVKAKGLRGVIPVLSIVALMLILFLVVAVAKLSVGWQENDSFVPFWFSLPLATLGALIYAYGLTGMVLAVSAVTRTTTASLISSYGLIFGVYVVLPGIVLPLASAITDSNELVRYLFAFQPYGFSTFTITADIWRDLYGVAVGVCLAGGIALQLAAGFFGMLFAADRIESLRRRGVSTVGKG
ncbi:hypothetical protein CCB80_11770 [Armatimonadetes bacterium Uphvl-Ar1]|nr:hypothetical protein CCB80_11770 [Armatimonadetes bacterium Uphvl-Ar1]